MGGGERRGGGQEAPPRKVPQGLLPGSDWRHAHWDLIREAERRSLTFIARGHTRAFLSVSTTSAVLVLRVKPFCEHHTRLPAGGRAWSGE